MQIQFVFIFSLFGVIQGGKVSQFELHETVEWLKVFSIAFSEWQIIKMYDALFNKTGGCIYTPDRSIRLKQSDSKSE